MIFKPFPDNDITQEGRIYIEEIQKMLRELEINRNGVSNVSVDGVFGPATTQAVQSFQQAYGLPITGTVDRNTYDRLIDTYNTSREKDMAVIPIFAFRPGDGVALRTGDIEDAVYFLNIMLRSIATVFRNIPFPTVSAEYTDSTAQAVRSMQRVVGLPITGVTDRRTWNRITALYNDLVYDLTVERTNPN